MRLLRASLAGQDDIRARLGAVEAASGGQASYGGGYATQEEDFGEAEEDQIAAEIQRPAAGGGGGGADGPTYRQRGGTDRNHQVFAPHARTHTRYLRPPMVDAASGAPKVWDLRGTKTYDTFVASKGSSLEHEFKTLYPAVSYLYDGVAELQAAVDELDPSDSSVLAGCLVRSYNTLSQVL